MAVLALGTGGAFYHTTTIWRWASGGWAWCRKPCTCSLLAIRRGGRRAFSCLKVRLAAGQRYSLQARLGYAAIIGGMSPCQGSPSSKLDSEAMALGYCHGTCRSRFTWSGGRGPPGLPWSRRLDLAACIRKSGRAGGGRNWRWWGFWLDSRGRLSSRASEAELDLNLTDATFFGNCEAGFTVSMTLEAPPGPTQCAACRDALEAS